MGEKILFGEVAQTSSKVQSLLTENITATKGKRLKFLERKIFGIKIKQNLSSVRKFEKQNLKKKKEYGNKLQASELIVIKKQNILEIQF